MMCKNCGFVLERVQTPHGCFAVCLSCGEEGGVEWFWPAESIDNHDGV